MPKVTQIFFMMTHFNVRFDSIDFLSSLRNPSVAQRGGYIIPILQIKKLRSREMMWLFQGHRDSPNLLNLGEQGRGWQEELWALLLPKHPSLYLSDRY